MSIHFRKNIVVYKDCKDNKVSCNLRDLDLQKSLDIVSWLVGVEWYEKDGFYFIGGNKDYIEVMDNTGIDVASLGAFSNVKAAEDKLIISGTERDVKRVRKAIEELQKRSYVTIRVYGYEVSEEADLKLGLDIDKALKYSFSWEALATYNYNPIQSLVMSIDASIEAEKNSDSMKQILNTTLTCISGKQQQIIVGEAVDRQLYTTSGIGQAQTFTSGYSTLQTGFTLNLSAFKYNKDWLFNVRVENSVEQSDVRRNNISLVNTVIASKYPSLIGRMIKDYETVTVSKGIPFICDLPWVGYLFKVTTEKQVRRNVLFFMEVVEEQKTGQKAALAPPIAGFGTQHFINFDLSSAISSIVL